MKNALICIVSVLALSACSTTKLLPEGEHMLVSSKVELRGEDRPRMGEISPYIRQQPSANLFGWNPLISVYNWSDGSEIGRAHV